MNFRFEALNIGEQYDRDQLASFWGYKARQAISRGIVTPAGHDLIILFVTEDKVAGMTPYCDRLDGSCLQMEGDGRPSSLRRLSALVGQEPASDAVRLFYRRKQRDRFTYCGSVAVLSADESHPNGYYWLQLNPVAAAELAAALSRTRDGASLNC